MALLYLPWLYYTYHGYTILTMATLTMAIPYLLWLHLPWLYYTYYGYTMLTMAILYLPWLYYT